MRWVQWALVLLPALSLAVEEVDISTVDLSLGTHFIKIYAPWCGHCRTLEPVWDELAEVLGYRVHVAKINGVEDRVVMHRFNVKAFPTLLFFKDGQMYRYKGRRRTVEALKEFALEGYLSYENPEKVPEVGWGAYILGNLENYALKINQKFKEIMTNGIFSGVSKREL